MIPELLASAVLGSSWEELSRPTSTGLVDEETKEESEEEGEEEGGGGEVGGEGQGEGGGAIQSERI